MKSINRTIVFFIASLLLYSCSQSEKSIDTEYIEITYTDDVSQEIIQKLEDYHKMLSTLYGAPVKYSYRLDKADNKYVLNLNLPDTIKFDSNVEYSIQLASYQLAGDVFGTGDYEFIYSQRGKQLGEVKPRYLGRIIRKNQYRDELFYGDEIPLSTANDFAEYLVKAKFFIGKGLKARIYKNDSCYVFNNFLSNEAFTNPQFRNIFKKIPIQISKDFFNFNPVALEPVDSIFNPLMYIPPFEFGESFTQDNLHLFYQSPVTPEKAQRLIDWLVLSGFNKGYSNFVLYRVTNSNEHNLIFPINPQLIDDNEYYETVEKFVNRNSKNLFAGQKFRVVLTDEYTIDTIKVIESK